MAWDDTKIDGNSLTPTEWNAHVTDQKSRNMTSYYNVKWASKTVIAGLWTVSTLVGQTDFDDQISATAGYMQNYSSPANNDELNFGNIVLNAGSYTIAIASIKDEYSGIVEILVGTTSLGTADLYAGAWTLNSVSAIAATPAVRLSGTLRVKVTGKNALSASYALRISRIEFIRTA